MTDNGSCYRSRIFRELLADNGIKHKWTRPYRPQTNGKVERFNRTLQEEWAYTRPYLIETNASRPSPSSFATTITSAATPHYEATHPSAAYPTWQVSTVSTGK